MRLRLLTFRERWASSADDSIEGLAVFIIRDQIRPNSSVISDIDVKSFSESGHLVRKVVDHRLNLRVD